MGGRTSNVGATGAMGATGATTSTVGAIGACGATGASGAVGAPERSLCKYLSSEALFLNFAYVASKIEPKFPFNLIFKENEGRYAFWVLNKICSSQIIEKILFRTQNAYRPSFSLKMRLNGNFGSILDAT